MHPELEDYLIERMAQDERKQAMAKEERKTTLQDVSNELQRLREFEKDTHAILDGMGVPKFEDTGKFQLGFRMQWLDTRYLSVSTALGVAARALQAFDIDEAMAGEFEIVADALKMISATATKPKEKKSEPAPAVD